MRAIWKGAITFGLVNVPVKVYSATEDHDISLHQVHDADGGRIRYQRRCEVCDKVVDYQNIDKAYDDGSTTVVLTEEDLKSLPEERSREIEVVEFVPSDQIDPIMFDRSYFLEPDSASLKAYALLRRALEETDRTAIVQFSLRQKTRLGALRARPSTSSGSGSTSSGSGSTSSGSGSTSSGSGSPSSGSKGKGSGGKGKGSAVLMLQSLLWDDEVREAKFDALKSDVKVSPQEVKMAGSLVKNMETDFAPDKFSDDYQEQLQKLIEAKIAEGDALDTAATFGEQPEEGDTGGDVIDLMEALRQSVERNRSNRSAAAAAKTGDSAKEPAAKKKPTKKSQDTKKDTSKATRETTTKKTATKKTATKKSAAKQAS